MGACACVCVFRGGGGGVGGKERDGLLTGQRKWKSSGFCPFSYHSPHPNQVWKP